MCTRACECVLLYVRRYVDVFVNGSDTLAARSKLDVQLTFVKRLLFY